MKCMKYIMMMVLGANASLFGIAEIQIQEITGSPFVTGQGSVSIAYSPVIADRLYAAVVNSRAGTVSIYTVDQQTGALTLVGRPVVIAGRGPTRVSYSPVIDGRVYAMVVNYRTVSIYGVDEDAGLRFIESFDTAPGLPVSGAYSPVIGDRVYAAVVSDDSRISVYTVNRQTGALTWIRQVRANQRPRSLSFSPVIGDRVYAAVAGSIGNTISVYEVDQNAELRPIGNQVTTGTEPASVAYSPVINGKAYAAVANNGDNTVSIYEVDNQTGLLTLIRTVATGGRGPKSVSFSPAIGGGRMYMAIVNDRSHTISVFEIISPIDVEELFGDIKHAAE